MVHDIMMDYLQQTGDINENANDGYSICGLKSYTVGKCLDEQALQQAVAGKEHRQGWLHIHDLQGSLYSAYCCGHDLRELLFNGLGSKQGTKSAPPKHFGSACDIMMNFMQILSNEWEGAQAFSDVDVLLAPYIYEDMCEGKIVGQSDVKQPIQSLIFGLNYESRQGMQTPFTNFTLRLYVPDNMKDEPVLCHGELKDYTYADMQPYMDMFNEALFDVMMEGDDHGKPFTFPIPTVTVDREEMLEVSEDTPVLQKLWELTEKFGSPYFANYLGAGGDPEDNKSMCCRLNLDVDKVKRATGTWDIGVKTGSLAVCTLNLNRIGIVSDDIQEYLDNLEQLFNIATQQLLQRKDYVRAAFYDYGLMPYSRKYVGSLESFFLTVGVVGAWESYHNLMSNHEFGTAGTSSMSYTQFCETVLNKLNELLDRNEEETDWKLWNLEQTPAEGSSNRLANLDVYYYPDAFVSGDEDGYFLTNSTHPAVYYNGWDVIDTLNFHSKTDKLYTGGTLKNLFIDNINSVDGIRKFVGRVLTNTQIPYLAYTPIYGVCSSHGVCKQRTEYCPECNERMPVFTRVVGYFRPMDKFNPGQYNQACLRRYDENNDSMVKVYADDGDLGR